MRASQEPPAVVLDRQMDVDTAFSTVAIRPWNVKGGFLLKIACCELLDELRRCDVTGRTA
jgi:hypothetical protein